MNNLRNDFQSLTSKLIPRILTQVCRDKYSSLYGSFDRNWWHYKIRDFPSIILQQGGYALFCYSKNINDEINKDSLFELVKASCSFWNKRAKKYGAFEEYYPWEQGYPPLAFSTLSILKLVDSKVIKFEEVRDGINSAATQLLHRFESKASNQQVAGLAALAYLRKIKPKLLDEKIFAELSIRTLQLQNDEGWFYEYGGPDLGYLSVTIDCLWDLYDATGNKIYIKRASKAIDFIYQITCVTRSSIGMLNSRNTDYLVPYGISRFLIENSPYKFKASYLLNILYSNINNSNHFLNAIDDRYYCHYIGHSLFRTEEILNKNKYNFDKMHDFNKDIHFLKSGFISINSKSKNYKCLIATKKGGSLIINFRNKNCIDFGWVVKQKGFYFVSNWWADFWQTTYKNNNVKITGYLTPHKENSSNPFKHFILRVLSLFFGKKIIPLLKELMIFKFKESNTIRFTRDIYLEKDFLKIKDIIYTKNNENILRAIRSSKRHVASADCYSYEDFQLNDLNIDIKESRKINSKSVEIITIYKH